MAISFPKPGAGVVRLVGLLAVGLLVIAAVVAFRPGSDDKTLTASFPRTVSIYEGSAVRILGVPVGKVETVEPAGTTVKVTMTYDPEVKVPADAKAAIIAPSVVGDRYVQLTPAYKSGPTLEDGADLGQDQTAVPLELDQIYQGLDDLAVGLGPEGANKDGALTHLLRSTARNFGGQGQQFHDTIRDLSQFTSTLDNNKEALFGTAREIERFVKALSDNDQTVRDFNDSLAGAADVLADERRDLAAALRNLGIAMEQVSGFVKENREALSSNIKGLVRVTDVFVKQRDALDQVLTTAPVALTNLFHTYNPRNGTLDTRSNIGENFAQLEENPAAYLCSIISPANPNDEVCDQIADLFPTAGAGRVGTASSRTPGRTIEIEHVDTTLGGILGAKR